MTNLAKNLSKLSEARQAAKSRRAATRASLTEFIDTRIKREEDPAVPTPVGGGAVQRRLSPENGHSDSSHQVTDRLGNKGGVDPGFMSALQRMMKDSGGKVSIGNSFRSPERQAQLWNAALKKYGSAAKARKWVAPPGKSNHGRGLAADLKYVDKDAIAWAHANAGKYGLNFPLSNENWHVEPVSARKKK